MGTVIISCVSNEDEFTKSVSDYLYGELGKQGRLEGGEDLEVTPDGIKFDPDSNEIRVDSNTHVPNGMIRRILESYLKSNASRFEDYGVIEFGDTFTIGRILHPSQMEMLTCEIRGFFTPYSAELHPQNDSLWDIRQSYMEMGSYFSADTEEVTLASFRPLKNITTPIIIRITDRM